MIFTKEQWFEVWKRHMGDYAESVGGEKLDHNRELGEPEFDGTDDLVGFPRPMNDVLLAIASADAAEIGIHPDWIELWASSEEHHMSLVWVILWTDQGMGGDRWRKPR
jgi:hypothetical protein